jgi:hypothetical protein
MLGKLQECRPGHRCANGACPECLRAFRRWTTHQIVGLASQSDDLRAVTIVPSSGFAEIGNLMDVRFQSMRLELEHAIAEIVGLRWAVFGLDFSLNDSLQRDGDIAWSAHWHGIIAGCGVEPTFLSPKFSSERAYRSVVSKRCDGSAYGVSYTLKDRFERRVSYWAARRFRPCWRASTNDLTVRPARQHVELVSVLSSLTLWSRLALFRIRPDLHDNVARLRIDNR